MIILDELAKAQWMHKNGFEKICSPYELSIYGKWLKYIGKTDDEVEKCLIEFSQKHDKNFNYQIHFYKIDIALRRINKYGLRLPIVTIITKSEWNKICNVNDERYRRVLFTMLVICKFLKNNNTRLDKDKKEYQSDKYGLFNITDAELCKIAKVSFNPKSDRDKMFRELRDWGLVDIISRKHTYRFILFVDEESDNFIEVKGYNNIIWYYDRQIGINIGECKECGKLFRQNKKNNYEYCEEHRNYIPIGSKVLNCINCGKEFVVDSKNNKSERCNDCQHKKNKQLKLKYYHKNKKTRISN